MQGECSWRTVCLCQSYSPQCGSVTIVTFFRGCTWLTVRCDENYSSVLGLEALCHISNHLCGELCHSTGKPGHFMGFLYLCPCYCSIPGFVSRAGHLLTELNPPEGFCSSLQRRSKPALQNKKPWFGWVALVESQHHVL